MARNYTSLDRSFLTSDTIAEMSDAEIVIFIRLLLVSDDWGRFPLNPVRLRRMMSDFRHTDEEILRTIERLLLLKCLHSYSVDDEKFCQWLKWDTYQQFRWQNEALCPDENGHFEASTNPGSKDRTDNPRNSAAKKLNKTKQNKTKQSTSKDLCNNDSNDDSKDISKEPALKPEKKRYLDCIDLTDDEYQKLQKRFNSKLDRALEIYDAWKTNSKKKNTIKSDYKSMLAPWIEQDLMKIPAKPTAFPPEKFRCHACQIWITKYPCYGCDAHKP